MGTYPISPKWGRTLFLIRAVNRTCGRLVAGFMPRAARLVLPDVAMHLVQRGINREPCFFSEGDYADYLRLLACGAKQYGVSIHAYCLMTNHVHLLLTPHQGGSGTLWEGHFHSALVASDGYALACYRYIELNPVRAGIVAHPGDYRWSSYRGNAQGSLDLMLSAHATYLALSDCAERRSSAYRALFDCSLREIDMEEIRKATRTGRRIGEQRRPRGRPPRRQK